MCHPLLEINRQQTQDSHTVWTGQCDFLDFQFLCATFGWTRNCSEEDPTPRHITWPDSWLHQSATISMDCKTRVPDNGRGHWFTGLSQKCVLQTQLGVTIFLHNTHPRTLVGGSSQGDVRSGVSGTGEPHVSQVAPPNRRHAAHGSRDVCGSRPTASVTPDTLAVFGDGLVQHVL